MPIVVNNTSPSDFAIAPVPLFRKFESDKKEISSSEKVGVKPTNKLINVSLKNFSDLENYKHFENFRLVYEIQGDDFFSLVGINQDDPIITPSINFQVNYYNYAQKGNGQYSAVINLHAIADNTITNKIEILESIEIPVDMEVNGMDLTLSEYNFFVQHTKDAEPSWVQNIDVTCSGVWDLLNGDMQNFSALLINGVSDQHMYFSGDQTIQLSFSQDINELPIGYHQLRVYFYQPSLVAEITIHLVVSENNVLSITPNSLEFSAIRFYQEADWQSVFVYSYLTPITYSAPDWCELGEVTIQGADEFIRIDVKPILSENLSPGVYNGQLKISVDGNNHYVPIKHTVHGVFDSKYDKDVHFTLDNEILKIFSQSLENTYVELTGEIKVYDYAGQVKSFTRKWQLSFFENVAEINLGRELDDYLDLLKSPIYGGQFLHACYKPMSIKITTREIRYEDEQVINVNRLPYQYFLRGRKPVSGKTNLWLNHNPTEPIRVTPKSLIFLNVFKSYGQPMEIIVKRNGELHETILWRMDENYSQPIFMKKLYDLSKITNIEPGETFGFVYNGIQRNYVIIPEQRHSVHVMWVNQFEVVDSFEFTGEHEMPVEYSSALATNYVDWVEVVRKIEQSKTQKLILNTGWIFKSNTRTIDDLISSKKAFLVNAGTGLQNFYEALESTIQLVPISKKMSAFDSKKNLYQYEVEFQINRKHEDAIYLR